MKRSKPLARTPLKRKTPLRRTGPIKARKPRRLSRPGSDPAYLAWVRTLPCYVASTWQEVGRCFPPVHAHHAIHRSQGGKDDVAVPLCQAHHDLWHRHNGPFRGLSRLERFAWAQQAITATQRAWAASRGEAVA